MSDEAREAKSFREGLVEKMEAYIRKRGLWELYQNKKERLQAFREENKEDPSPQVFDEIMDEWDGKMRGVKGEEVLTREQNKENEVGEESYAEWRERKIESESIDHLSEEDQRAVMEDMEYERTKDSYDWLKDEMCDSIMRSRHSSFRGTCNCTKEQKAEYWETNSKFAEVYPCSHEEEKEPSEKHYEERLNELLGSRRVPQKDRLNEAYKVLMREQGKDCPEVATFESVKSPRVINGDKATSFSMKAQDTGQAKREKPKKKKSQGMEM